MKDKPKSPIESFISREVLVLRFIILHGPACVDKNTPTRTSKKVSNIMALFPRMTRPGLRITLEALAAYIPTLPAEGQQIAQDVVKELQYQLTSANQDNRRRQADNERN